MAKIQNTFIKSKMNKDLDDRLITNGEYRNAINVNVSRSESSDVGALENVLGNEFVENFQKNSKLSINEVIGVHIDEVNEIIYAFSTDYCDNSSNNLSNKAPYNSTCLITSYNIQTKTFGVLVSGSFLNFSKTHPILNIDLIENLLFFTDNRNQPRKINVEILPNSNYYTTEDQISVAKYYPYVAPNLYNSFRLTNTKCSSISGELPTIGLCDSSTSTPLDVTGVKVGMQIVLSDLNLSGTSQGGNVYVSSVGVNSFQVTSIRPDDINWSEQSIQLFGATSTNVSSQFLAPYFIGLTKTSSTVNTIIVHNTYADQNVIKVGDLVSQSGIPNLTTVEAISQGTNETTLTLQNTELTGDLDTYLTPFKSADQFVLISSPNPDYDKNWPGDSEFLKDKFVRFAYRYKFDDGEYSLISPFTQPAFIPKQDGYFTPGVGGIQGTQSDKVLLPQETTTMGSTIVSFMENKVDNVKINIPTPYPVNELQQKLKVSEIDILYKESDGLAIKVLESVPIEDANSQTSYVYTYDYQSRKPYKVLPEKEVSRVYDQVPIRALTQSISGNRVIYGNFIDRHTSPKNLNFSVVASEKTNVWKDSSSYSTIAYPNHTLKQNRIYQVGIVLADRYGRQSDVVLSSIGNSTVNFPVGTDTFFSGSTLYHPYRGTGLSPSNIQNWFGDSLKILFEGTVPKTRTDAPGYPGLYKSGKIEVNIKNYQSNTTLSNATDIVFDGRIEEVEVGDLVTGVDASGVSFEAYVIIGAVSTNANDETVITVEGSYTLDVNSQVTIFGRSNDLGWYSYKIVVKQTSQEYYNIYAPSIVAGDLDNNNTQNTVSTVTLISDNVNKLPSDLQDVQPQQTQFRTSDSIIYPRVGGKVISSATYFPSYQSFLGRNYFTVDTMGKTQDMGFSTSSNPTKGIFNVQSNPPIARITTDGSSFGNLKTESLFDNTNTDYTNFNEQTKNYAFPLTVLEVKPKESLLDIFWETSTSGLISELNNSTLNFTNLGIPFQLRIENDLPGNPAFEWNESDDLLSNPSIQSTGTFFQGDNDQLFVGDGKKIVDRVYVVDQLQGPMPAAIIELTDVKRNGISQNLSDFGLIANLNTSGEFYLTVKKAYSFRAVAGSGQTGVNDFEFFVTATNTAQGITYTNDFSFTGTLGNATPEIHGNFTPAGPTPADDPSFFGTSDGTQTGPENFSMFTVFWLNYLRGFGNRNSVPGTPPTDGKVPLFKIPCSNGAYMFPFDRAFNLEPNNPGPRKISPVLNNNVLPGGGSGLCANVPYQDDTLNNGTSTEDLVLTIEEVWFSDDLSTGINVPSKTWTPTTDPTTYNSSIYPDVSWFEVVKTMPRREITSLFALDLGANPGNSENNFRNGLNSNWDMNIFGSSALGTSNSGISNPTAVSNYDVLENCAPVFGPNILQEEIPNSAGWRNVDATQGEGWGVNLFPPHGENYNLIQNVQTTKAAFDKGTAVATYNSSFSYVGQSTHTKYNSWCGGGLKRNVFSPQDSTLVGRAGGQPHNSGDSPVNPGDTIMSSSTIYNSPGGFNVLNWENIVGGTWSSYNSIASLGAGSAYNTFVSSPWYPLGWYNQSEWNSNKPQGDVYNSKPPTWVYREDNFETWAGSNNLGAFKRPGLKWANSGSSVWNGDRISWSNYLDNSNHKYSQIIPQKNPGATEQQNPISNFIIVLNRPLTAVRDSNHTLSIPSNNAKIEFSGGNTPSGPGPLASSGTSNPESGSYPIAFPYLPSELTDTGTYITKDIMEMGGYNYAQADGLNFTGYVNTPIQTAVSAGNATSWASFYVNSNPSNSLTSSIWGESTGQNVVEGNFFENIYNYPDIGYATPGDNSNSVANSFPSWLIDVSGTVNSSGWSTQQSSYKILEPALAPADYRIKIKLTDGGALETYKWITFRVVNPEITYSNTNPINSRNLQNS